MGRAIAWAFPVECRSQVTNPVISSGRPSRAMTSPSYIAFQKGPESLYALHPFSPFKGQLSSGTPLSGSMVDGGVKPKLRQNTSCPPSSPGHPLPPAPSVRRAMRQPIQKWVSRNGRQPQNVQLPLGLPLEAKRVAPKNRQTLTHSHINHTDKRTNTHTNK